MDEVVADEDEFFEDVVLDEVNFDEADFEEVDLEELEEDFASLSVDFLLLEEDEELLSLSSLAFSVSVEILLLSGVSKGFEACEDTLDEGDEYVFSTEACPQPQRSISSDRAAAVIFFIFFLRILLN